MATLNSPRFVPGDLVMMPPRYAASPESGIILEVRRSNGPALRAIGIVGMTISTMLPFQYIVLCPSGIRGPFESRQLMMVNPTTEPATRAPVRAYE